MNVKPVNKRIFLKMKMQSESILMPETSTQMEPVATVLEVADDVTVCAKGDTILFLGSPSVVRVPDSFGKWCLFALESDIVAVLETAPIPMK